MNYAIPLKRNDYPPRFIDFKGIIPINYELMNKIFPNIISDTLLNVDLPFMARMGHLSKDELIFLIALVKWMKPRRIFEIGTFDGLTTINLIKNTPNDCEIFTLDIPESEVENSKFKINNINKEMIINSKRLFYLNYYKELKKRIHILEGDSGIFDFSPYYNSIDLIFVDACHTFEYCYNDSLNALKLLVKGGLVIWHDYNKVKYNPGVTEALNKLAREKEISMYWFNDPIINGGQTSIVIFSIHN